MAKLTLDYCVLHEDQNPVRRQILNTQKSINLFLRILAKDGSLVLEILFVFENTGIYSSLLSFVLSGGELDYMKVPAL